MSSASFDVSKYDVMSSCIILSIQRNFGLLSSLFPQNLPCSLLCVIILLSINYILQVMFIRFIKRKQVSLQLLNNMGVETVLHNCAQLCNLSLTNRTSSSGKQTYKMLFNYCTIQSGYQNKLHMGSMRDAYQEAIFFPTEQAHITVWK